MVINLQKLLICCLAGGYDPPHRIGGGGHGIRPGYVVHRAFPGRDPQEGIQRVVDLGGIFVPQGFRRIVQLILHRPAP